MTLVWSNEAQEAVRDIVSSLFDQSPTLADAWSDELEKKIALLASFPEMGRSVPEFDISFIREIFIRTYRLIYTYQNETIIIVTIRPMSRPLGRL